MKPNIYKSGSRWFVQTRRGEGRGIGFICLIQAIYHCEMIAV